MHKFTVEMDLNDYIHDDENVVDFLIREMKRSLLSSLDKSVFDEVRASIDNHFSASVQTAVSEEIERKLEAFLGEEISIRGEWGKPSFVGSIDDYLKKRFDDALLHQVDSCGRNITGCQHGQGQTYVEWLLGKKMEDRLKDEIARAEKTIVLEVKSEVQKQLEDIKTKAASELVAKALGKIIPDNVVPSSSLGAS